MTARHEALVLEPVGLTARRGRGQTRLGGGDCIIPSQSVSITWTKRALCVASVRALRLLGMASLVGSGDGVAPLEALGALEAAARGPSMDTTPLRTSTSTALRCVTPRAVMYSYMLAVRAE